MKGEGRWEVGNERILEVSGMGVGRECSER